MTRLIAGLGAILAGCTAAGEGPATPPGAGPPTDSASFSLIAETWEPAPPATTADRDADRAPYSPRTPPDHVISLETVGDAAPTERHTIRRHGGWARIEVTDRNAASTYHVSFVEPVTVSFDRQPDGRYAYIEIRRAQTYDGNPPPLRRTGERDVVLGESCEVWDVSGRTLSPSHSARKLSCVTSDGIEMWSRYVGERGFVQEMRAVSLDRRAVRASEVTPPADLLDPKRWPLTWPVGGASLDVWLASGAAGEKWRREKRYQRLKGLERIDSRDSIEWADRDTGALARFNRSADGQYLTLFVHDGQNTAGFGGPVPLDEAPLVFGAERCRWFDMMPNVADAGRSACLLEDGSLLAERLHSRGGRVEFLPLMVDRSRQRSAALRPPAAVINPANWGLPAPGTP